MKTGDLIKVTSGQLGGYNNELCNGRPTDDVVKRGTIGKVVRPAEWMEGTMGLKPLWFVAKFPHPDGDLYVPCVEGDHVEVYEKA